MMGVKFFGVLAAVASLGLCVVAGAVLVITLGKQNVPDVEVIQALVMVGAALCSFVLVLCLQVLLALEEHFGRRYRDR